MDNTQNEHADRRLVPVAGYVTGIEWPNEPGIWTRDGEEWTAKQTADGQMWIIPPDPEDGCIPRMLADLAQPPVLGRWIKSHTK